MTTTESPTWPYRTTNGDLEFWRHVAELVIENDPQPWKRIQALAADCRVYGNLV